VSTLNDVITALRRAYNPAWAESWDAVGLVCGDPVAAVQRVHFAVDPVAAVVDEALASGADLLVTHHPLFLGGTTTVAATTAKGNVIHRLIGGGCALYVAHTNADVADPGVSDALAGAVGLRDVRPLQPHPDPGSEKLVTFVPASSVDTVLDALAAAGAGMIGDYDRCAFLTPGTGTFRPGAVANPTIGTAGEIERVEEIRVEMVVPATRRTGVVRALLAVHPYEEPAFDLIPLVAPPSGRGLGRVGELAEPMTLRTFTKLVATSLPATAWGVRAAGDPDRPVGTVAVCGGSGGGLAETAAHAGADVLLTSDLKHHATSEATEDGVVALVDAAHWATEWPWLAQAAEMLATAATVETTVSTIVTDPWTVHADGTA
jgi:dinuclear metal center YbgI/SA1388 family protein